MVEHYSLPTELRPRRHLELEVSRLLGRRGVRERQQKLLMGGLGA